MRPEKRYGASLLLAASLFLVYLISSPWPSGRAAARLSGAVTPSSTADSGRTPFPGFPIDINIAGREELMMLPGVGPKTAGRILDKREELGGFSSMEDLLTVKHISRARLDKMRSLASAR